ncbi:DUF3313 family protein [Asaia platycodi]|uniref:DUF3313 family protein n=1 Tax=Asaia platycodi TaxID=610243 RepID=UPI00046F100B|nr:DUF3313 family protein [Asaia platycodi]
MPPHFSLLVRPSSRGFFLPLLLSCAGVLALSGCAGQKTTQTGFIAPQTYAQMVHPKGHMDDLVYVAPGLQPGAYRYAVIDPVLWHPVNTAPVLEPEIQARMTEAFESELRKTLGEDFKILPASPLVTAPSGPFSAGNFPPGTLRISAAITNLRRSKWYYNALPIVAGFAAGAAGGGLPPIPPPAPGGASEELLATDAVTGASVLAIATYNNGMPWNMVGQWLPYAHARRAFHLAALLMKEEVHKTGLASASPAQPSWKSPT